MDFDARFRPRESRQIFLHFIDDAPQAEVGAIVGAGKHIIATNILATK